MRIMIIHQYFLGQDAAGGARWNQMAKYWSEAGHDVTVLAGMVDYNTGKKPERYNWRFIKKERADPDVTVYRCHVSQRYNSNFLGRAWAYFSFAFSSTIAGLLFAKRPDVIIATSPPLTVSTTMNWLGWFRRRPTVFEVRDLWPESAIDTGVIKPGRLANLLYKMEKKAYQKAKLINVLTPVFREKLVNNKGVTEDRICMIPNGADLDLLAPGEKNNYVREQHNLQDKFVVGYFGAHGRANKLSQLLDVAEAIKDSHANVQIILVGGGMLKPDLITDARRRDLKNVTFIDPVSKEKIADYINATDVCTAVLMKNDTFKTVYPNKVFDYMCCSRPTLIGIDGAARKLITDAGAGIYVEPENTEDFINGIDTLQKSEATRQEMGVSGRKHVEQFFDRQKLADEYLNIISDLVDTNR